MSDVELAYSRTGRGTLLASVGFLVAGVMVYITSIVNSLGLLVLVGMIRYLGMSNESKHTHSSSG